MGRGLAFTYTEDKFILEHGEEKTAKELLDIHNQMRHEMIWPQRTLKSIARRLERLREDGLVGVRDLDTRRKAYSSRGKLRSQ